MHAVAVGHATPRSDALCGPAGVTAPAGVVAASRPADDAATITTTLVRPIAPPATSRPPLRHCTIPAGTGAPKGGRYAAQGDVDACTTPVRRRRCRPPAPTPDRQVDALRPRC